MAIVEVKAMNMLARIKQEGPIVRGVRSAALLVASCAIVACDGANQGVQIGTGNQPDPVTVARHNGTRCNE